MKSQKSTGEEKKGVLTLLILLFISSPLMAEGWTSGHHEINDGDEYWEIWMYNDATADMWGGDVVQLYALDSSEFSMYGGLMNTLVGRYDSTINIYGGNPSGVGLSENTVLNLYAYDVMYHITDGGDDWSTGWLEGRYNDNDYYFVFDFSMHDDSQLNIVPEPMSFLLLSLGFLVIRRKN